MLKRKSKGPTSYTQWTAALAAPLTAENAEYMRRGEFKQKSAYAALFNRISDYVTDTLDKRIKLLGRSESSLDTVYELKRFGSVLHRLFFFKDLRFIAKRDSAALSAAIKKAVTGALGGKPEDGSDPELEFELAAIMRAVNSES